MLPVVTFSHCTVKLLLRSAALRPLASTVTAGGPTGANFVHDAQGALPERPPPLFRKTFVLLVIVPFGPSLEYVRPLHSTSALQAASACRFSPSFHVKCTKKGAISAFFSIGNRRRNRGKPDLLDGCDIYGGQVAARREEARGVRAVM